MLRFAPSQTKSLDIESLRIAIFNYILSKQLNEGLAIRIEDGDKENNIEGKDKEILEILNLFSMDYKDALYQSNNFKYHQKMAMQFLTQKKAFSCFCSEDKLNELKERAKEENRQYVYDDFCASLSDETVLEVNAPFTVRIKRPKESIKFTDLLKGEYEFSPNDLDSFIILNQEKAPTYNYACAIDDMIMDISVVIKADCELDDTPKQIFIRKSLGYDKDIKYVHLPAITTKNESESLVRSLIEDGFLPASIANYLVLLGYETPKEIFTLEDAVEWFDIEKVSKDVLEFDIEKLKEINKKHLESFDELRLSKLLAFADEDIGKLAKLYLSECSTLREIKKKLNLIFSAKSNLDGFNEELTKIKECIKNAPFIEEFSEFETYISENSGLKDDSLSKPLRYALTGTQSGPKLMDIYPLIKNYLGEIVK